jgi:release factor glutamine methyltransferase
LEAELLLRHALSLTKAESPAISRAFLLARLADAIDADASACYDGLLRRRLGHEPSAYITGRREFYGLELEVTPDTLIPRPETETLVETALEFLAELPLYYQPNVADVGTGSGAIAIALARTCLRAAITATDVSYAGLDVAHRNAKRHGVASRISFCHGDLLTPVRAPLDLVVANLPYVSSGDLPGLAPEVRDYEPVCALDGGPEGMDPIRRLLRLAPSYLHPRGGVCLEFGDGQAGAVQRLATSCLPGATIALVNDLAGRPRVLKAVTS